MPRPGTITLIVFLMFVIAVWKTASIPATASASNEIFTDITEQAGITWQQFGGESPDRFLYRNHRAEVSRSSMSTTTDCSTFFS